MVATFYPLAFFAERIAGDNLAVATLVPAGTEPHDWEPRPSERVRVERASVFVYNGAGLEPWADEFVRDLTARGAVVVEATRGLALREADRPHEGDPGQDETGTHEEHEGTKDPHVWLDPVLAQGVVENIRAGLARADPGNATAYGARATSFSAELAALHGEFERGLARCGNRNILTTHAAFGYLADRYDFLMHSVHGLTPEAEPSPAKIREMVNLARALNLTHVFFETLVSPRVAEVIADEVGAQVLVLNPIEGLTAEERAAGKTYFDLHRQNLANLRLAMRCG